jgi:tRNA (guanine-N7-)-methyltransferase
MSALGVIDEAVPWRLVFGNDRPVEVEIGPGRGEVLLAAAARAPATNFFAIERAAGAVEAIRAKAGRAGLANVRIVAGDARCIVARLVPDASVAAYRILFPDPWPKTRHRRRRLMAGGLAPHLVRTLEPGGRLDLASDLPTVIADFSEALVRAGLEATPGATLPPDRPRTAFERRYAGLGTIHACFRRPS